MDVGGIKSSNYPAWYNNGNGSGGSRICGRTEKSAAKNVAQNTADFAGQITQRKQAAGTQPELVLHGNNDADEGETVVGSSVNALTGVSIAVYKPQDFDAANPVYHVKTWDADGNMTERMVDISKVDPKSSDEIEMSAYTWYLSNSGQCPDAFMKFASARSYAQTEQQKYTADSVFDKVNWVDIIRDFMQMQYDAHNMKGYLDYKKLLGFLEK